METDNIEPRRRPSAIVVVIIFIAAILCLSVVAHYGMASSALGPKPDLYPAQMATPPAFDPTPLSTCSVVCEVAGLQSQETPVTGFTP